MTTRRQYDLHTLVQFAKASKAAVAAGKQRINVKPFYKLCFFA